jgi:hypothetical protein
MTKYNNTEVDAATSILFCLFDIAWVPTVGESEGPNELLREHKTLVDGTCHVLEWLGLVEADSQLALGCKPTERLGSILDKRGAGSPRNSKKASASIEETDVINSIFDAAVPDEDQPYVCPLAGVLLHVLGLVRYTQNGDQIPTHDLRLLAAERREGERNRRWLKSIEAGEWPPKGVFQAIGLPA